MKSYSYNFLLLILMVLTIEADSAPIPEETSIISPTPSPESSSTPDSKLEFAFGNQNGQFEQVTIYNSEISRANLSKLVDWLHSLDHLREFLEKVKKDNNPDNVRCVVAGPDQQPHEGRAEPEKIEESLKMVADFEQRIEKELRKPGKAWNYPAEKEAEAANI